jgi:dTDP-4-dehydrorhamnose reductase
MLIVIIGSGGRLGAALLREYRSKFGVTGLTHAEIDLSDHDEVEQMVSRLKFDVLINCAALTNVDLCEEQPDQAFQINAGAPELLARICDEKNARLIHFSTDYVFDGGKTTPYVEDDEAAPLSVYGESKREGEEKVLAVNDQHLVIRVSWVFGPDRPSFIDNIVKRAQQNEQVEAVADKFSTPTYTRDIAGMLPRFFEKDIGGLLHLTNGGEASWQEYAQYALDCCRETGVPLRATTVGSLSLSDMKSFVAQRPAYTVLATERYQAVTGNRPRPWREAVAEYVREFVARKGA